MSSPNSPYAIDVLSPTQDDDNRKSIEEVSRTFVSDTVTVPTKEMHAYAARASLGDAVYVEPSTARLEKHIAKITGKEDAMFVPSGTMSNQIALRTHLVHPPHSVLCDLRSHIYKYEAGGMAFHSQASTITLFPANGRHLTATEIAREVITDPDTHFAQTKVISLENTLNGIIFPQDEILKIAEVAKEKDIKVHLDGARIWHVAAETGLSLSELCEPFDSVSVCFSKGLGAPVGSCLTGSKPFIAKARAFRKLFGGGMRQTGYLAACAAFALTHHFPLLPSVHMLARKLENGLQKLGARVTAPVDTCMVFYDPAPLGLQYEEILERGAMLPNPIKFFGSRLVVHVQTSESAVDDLLALLATMTDEKRQNGFIPSAEAQNNGITSTNIYVRPQKKVGN